MKLIDSYYCQNLGSRDGTYLCFQQKIKEEKKGIDCGEGIIRMLMERF